MTQKFTHETLPLHSTASNTKFEIDVWRYSHPDATQTVFLQGGIHGIELTGIPVIHEFIKEIEENQLRLSKMELEKEELIGFTAEAYSARRINEHYMYNDFMTIYEQILKMYKQIMINYKNS